MRFEAPDYWAKVERHRNMSARTTAAEKEVEWIVPRRSMVAVANFKYSSVAVSSSSLLLS